MASSVIIVPCYNEEGRLHLEEFRAFAAAHSSIRFVFVDDGSTDGTPELLQELEKADGEHFGLLALSRNVGKAEAVRAGMVAAFAEGPDYAGYWDADLAAPLSELPRFVDLLERSPGLEAVFGSRVRLLGHPIERRALRHGLGRVFATAVAHLLDLPVYDTQCGAKLFRVSPETEALFEEPFCTGWAFDVELLARWLHDHKAGGRADPRAAIRELPLEHWRDVPGSKVRPADFLRAWLELWRIRRRYL